MSTLLRVQVMFAPVLSTTARKMGCTKVIPISDKGWEIDVTELCQPLLWLRRL
jgi:hypothetical protein